LTSYNFNNYFAQSEEKENRKVRTRNLFYVVCSRVKRNLAILCISQLTDTAKQGVKHLFGDNNYVEI